MQNVTDEVRVLTARLIKQYKPEKIILFGSAASGKARQDSDIDLFIIKNSTQKRPLRVQEVFQALRGIKRTYPLDPIVYTSEEVEKRLSLGDYFIKRVFQEGKVLYG